MTKEEALLLVETKWWEGLDARSIVSRQIYEDRLCIPFDLYHKAVEEVLGRDVYVHEFAYSDRLKAEFEGRGGKPTIEDIINLIPPEKRLVIAIVPGQKTK